MYVRIQTWFPFTVQIYVNGHDWLAQQLAKKRSGFVQHDNCFTELDDPVAAQRLADRFFDLAWKSRLNRWAQQINPLLKQVPWLRDMEYRWVIDQFEYSTDVLFRSRQHLAELYPRLLTTPRSTSRPRTSSCSWAASCMATSKGSAQPVPEGSPTRRSH